MTSSLTDTARQLISAFPTAAEFYQQFFTKSELERDWNVLSLSDRQRALLEVQIPLMTTPRRSGHHHLTHCLITAYILEKFHPEPCKENLTASQVAELNEATDAAAAKRHELAIAHDLVDVGLQHNVEAYRRIARELGPEFTQVLESCVILGGPRTAYLQTQPKQVCKMAAVYLAQESGDKEIMEVRLCDRIANMLELDFADNMPRDKAMAAARIKATVTASAQATAEVFRHDLPHLYEPVLTLVDLVKDVRRINENTYQAALGDYRETETARPMLVEEGKKFLASFHMPVPRYSPIGCNDERLRA
jgi:(p)ppGpp synthase/HD superfamily hydrolase